MKFYPKPKKYMGQNFLKDTSVAEEIVDLAGISENDYVIEIGGGTGVITEKLSTKASVFEQLDVYELDSKLSKLLADKFETYKNIRVLNENILDASFPVLNNIKIIGAIPYNITSPIIHKILELKARPVKVVLMIQKEVATKISSKQPKANYWSAATLGYDIKYEFKVPADSFYPSPKVDSAVITMTLDEEDFEILKRIGFKKWSRFLHMVFKNPRKKLRNSGLPEESMKKAGIDVNLRPQNLEKQQLINLYDIISSNLNK